MTTEMELIERLGKQQKEMSEAFLTFVNSQVEHNKLVMDRIVELGDHQIELLAHIKDIYSRIGLKIQQEKPHAIN